MAEPEGLKFGEMFFGNLKMHPEGCELAAHTELAECEIEHICYHSDKSIGEYVLISCDSSEVSPSRKHLGLSLDELAVLVVGYVAAHMSQAATFGWGHGILLSKGPVTSAC